MTLRQAARAVLPGVAIGVGFLVGVVALSCVLAAMDAHPFLQMAALVVGVGLIAFAVGTAFVWQANRPHAP